MYVAVKGGERAIANAHALLAKEGRGASDVPRIDAVQVAGQLGVVVSRIMTEGSLYDPELAARALLQAQGDVLEAVTLLRSYRTTLPRFGYTEALDTSGLPPQRRISATFKDLPGASSSGPPSTTRIASSPKRSPTRSPIPSPVCPVPLPTPPSRMRRATTTRPCPASPTCSAPRR